MDNNNEIPSQTSVISENFGILFSGQKKCPRCGTQMSVDVLLCPNCSTYTPGIVGVQNNRGVRKSAREQAKDQNKSTNLGCLGALVVLGVIIGLIYAVSKLPDGLILWGAIFILLLVSGMIYLLLYLFNKSIYSKQIPKTEVYNHADSFSTNFRKSDE